MGDSLTEQTMVTSLGLMLRHKQQLPRIGDVTNVTTYTYVGSDSMIIVFDILSLLLHVIMAFF